MPSSSGNQPIPAKNSPSAGHHDIQSAFASSFRSGSPLAQEMLARDLAECSDEDGEVPFDTEAIEEGEDDDEADALPGPTLYRRPSGIAFGTTRPAFGPGALDEPALLTRTERTRSRDEERSLLRDNHILPPKHQHHRAPKKGLAGQVSGLYKRLFSTKVRLPAGDEESPHSRHKQHRDRGLATSLDTLCAQAFGSGHKHLVGLQLQRMTYFLLLLLLPVAFVWLHAEPILASMIEKDSAALAASYLRIALLGTPAYAAFEGGKRFVQAQGLFHATTYVLLVAAPTNMLLNWLFVWKFGWGFVGAPTAVAITQNMLPMLLFLYVWKVDGSQAWGGFRRSALKNWGPMIRLALPGMIMVVAEWFAFEILTLASGRMGVEFLAAQSVLVTVTSTTFQIPFPLSIAGSTRLANLIGAKLVDAAKTSAKVTIVGGALVGLFNVILLSVFRYHIPLLFTHDREVIELVARTLPVCAIMQLFDSMAAVSHALLRGIGRQEFGGYANLVCYYLVALPISFGLGFGLDWKLSGLWIGVTIGLLTVSVAEYWFTWRVDWHQAAREAESRNASG
ncbi:hypothetical protein CHGG_04642 [Chaetomium globosum CBS 148.51]|uniref:Uncharacterized protein n=1 Tax=Chaetomium globosum (strain ATCC 6205 / CBS 148.51 / DSM 1962 / NBRC 6347 / NRRL 1970) TaxID=306901 RepID=Q2H0Q4_CHAGB|nr:uncharacterized protein CHGG_04642 [Chaetomium globosum CBS 148.51]EAQ88023.1 hypothetical protein CHGG_04642 [Chaetomium globosum CBS 148.51]